MLVADIVIQTLPGRAPGVEEHVARLGGFDALRVDGDHQVSGTWRGPDGDNLESLAEALVALEPDIVAVYPTSLRSHGE